MLHDRSRTTTLQVSWASILAFAVAASASASDALLRQDAHCFLGGTKSTKNFGSAELLELTPSRSVLLQFDLSTVPHGDAAENIAKANLWLSIDSVKEAGEFDVHAVSTLWLESTVTGATLPTASETDQDPSAQLLGEEERGRFVVVDVTEIVKTWVGGATNFGLVIETSAESALDVRIDSQESPIVRARPRLEVILKQAGADGPAGAQGEPGDTGPQGDLGPMGPPGADNNTQGNTGATGPTGAQGSSGVVRSAAIAGPASTLNSSGTYTFMSNTNMTITVGTGETLHVYGLVSLGTASGGGAASTNFAIGYRTSGSGSAPTPVNVSSAVLPALMRVPIFAQATITGLGPGTYEVGLCYSSTVSSWNYADWARGIAFVTQ